MKFRYEPALTIALIVAILNFLVHGFDISWLDSDTIEAIATGIITLLGGFFIRRKVVPVRKLEDQGHFIPR